MGRWAVVVALVVLTGCGRLTNGAEAVSDAGAGGTAGGGSAGGDTGDPNCMASSAGQTICPKPGQRFAEWDTYAIADDGRTVTVTFTDRPSSCTQIEELSGDVLPTEVHLTLSVVDTQKGCDERVAREASVTLSEPVAGRPVYSAISVSKGGGGMSTMGYSGSVQGPECHGPDNPAPGAHVSDCPSPTSGPPPPLKTVVAPDAKRARPVPWTAVTVSDDGRRLELQWISATCARLGGVALEDDGQKPAALLVTLSETRCNGGDEVVRSTVVTLDAPLGRKALIDGTHAVR